jgi:hypothetical protein
MWRLALPGIVVPALMSDIDPAGPAPVEDHG